MWINVALLGQELSPQPHVDQRSAAWARAFTSTALAISILQASACQRLLSRN